MSLDMLIQTLIVLEIYMRHLTIFWKDTKKVAAKDTTLVFYYEHIRPFVTQRWNIKNTLLHMAAFAVNPKWCAELDGRVPSCDDLEVLDGFSKVIDKMFSEQEPFIPLAQFLDFTNPRSPNLRKPQARLDRVILAQKDPIGWWSWHDRDTRQSEVLATHFFAQVANSSIAERNWSIYDFIHLLKRNIPTSR